MNDPESAYNWLKRGENEFYSYALHGLVTRMRAEARAGMFSTALTRMQELATASQSVDRLDKAKICLESALTACKMHDPTLAAHQLETALQILGAGADQSREYAHTYAITNWILGLLELALSTPAVVATTAWQNSLAAFEYLATEPMLSGFDQAWYLERRAEMLEAIDEALDGRNSRPVLLQATLQPGSQASLDVFDGLSIVKFGPPGLPSRPSAMISLRPSQVDFHLAGRTYHLFSLREPDLLLVLEPARQYCALKVSGDWMNRIEVDPEDYVLLRLEGQGESGDIVAVEVFNHNPSAMVYHLFKDKDDTLLRPQSLNPAHQILKFSPAEGNRYHLHGVVLGVFKPSVETLPPAEPAAAGQNQETASPPITGDSPIPVGDFLQTFRVFSAIPAGGPRVAPTFTGRQVEIDRFIIDGQPYTIKNLRANGKRINPRSGNVIVLKVSGDSMNDPNRANIQNGDYVLLRRQDTAEDGDIIAAEIRGEDTLATLKRYEIRSSDRVALVPESTNPEHQEREFSRPKSGKPPTEPPFYIQGIALAVFKPYP